MSLDTNCGSGAVGGTARVDVDYFVSVLGSVDHKLKDQRRTARWWEPFPCICSARNLLSLQLVISAVK